VDEGVLRCESQRVSAEIVWESRGVGGVGVELEEEEELREGGDDDGLVCGSSPRRQKRM
jgi:hypothetical protein